MVLEFDTWIAELATLYHVWQDVLRKHNGLVSSGEWFAIFKKPNSNTPIVVCKAEESCRPKLGASLVEIPQKTKMYIVNKVSCTLEPTPLEQRMLIAMWDDRGDNLVNKVFGYVGRVRMYAVKRGQRKVTILFYYGLVCKLYWDPERFRWPKGKVFMNYTLQLGRDILCGQNIVSKVVACK